MADTATTDLYGAALGVTSGDTYTLTPPVLSNAYAMYTVQATLDARVNVDLIDANDNECARWVVSSNQAHNRVGIRIPVPPGYRLRMSPTVTGGDWMWFYRGAELLPDT